MTRTDLADFARALLAALEETSKIGAELVAHRTALADIVEAADEPRKLRAAVKRARELLEDSQ